MATKMIVEQIFQMPTNPKFDESIISPWKHVHDDSMEEETGNLPSFSETFAQLHHQESSSNSSSLYTLSPSSSLTSEFSHDFHPPSDDDERKLHLLHTRSGSVSSCISEVCNDVESSDDREDDEEIHHYYHARRESRSCHSKRWRSRRKFGGFPPPISCIGISGEPWVWLQSTRQDGRFILREVRIPTQELMHGYRQNVCLKVDIVQSDEEEEEKEMDKFMLHRYRENGRLKLHIVQSDEEEEKKGKSEKEKKINNA